MKKIRSYFKVIALLMLWQTTNAQVNYLYGIAGRGNPPTGIGDGGPAVDSKLETPTGVGRDGAGNLYIADYNRIRKIDAATGIINTIAGTGTAGFSGDGGPAINAQMSGPNALYADFSGNIYFTDGGNKRVRKIDVGTGNINTVAGGGLLTNDGVPATSYQLDNPSAIAVDRVGNIYILTGVQIRKVTAANGLISTLGNIGNEALGIVLDPSNNYLYIGEETGTCRIRKMDVNTGVTTTFAGTGSCGFSGDGGPATNAKLDVMSAMAFDVHGNLLVGGYVLNKWIRKIDAVTGIITTVAGGHGDGIYKENIPALATDVHAHYMCAGLGDDIYFSGEMDHALEKVSPYNLNVFVTSDSFSVGAYDHCSDAQFSINTAHFSPGMSVRTSYGDAQYDTHNISPGFGGGIISFSHSYVNSGTYQVSHVLYDGASPVDSVTYAYHYVFCRTLPVRLYQDVNADCIYDSATDHHLFLPSLIEVDSNSLPVDSVSLTEGVDYDAKGNSGDTYSFKVLSTSPGLLVSCPTNGIATQVIQAATNNYQDINLGFDCISGSDFDLSVVAILQTHANNAVGDIVVSNSYCSAENASLTMNISPKYIFRSSTPMPTSQTANSVTWNINSIAATMPNPMYLHFSLDIATPQNLTVGDTVINTFRIAPVAGDVNPANNILVVIDTILGPWDPNEKDVTPQGHIYAGTKLQYSISFENTGNDTAHNIYVLDTLSDNVDVSSLRIIASTAAMVTSYYTENGHNVVKFNFPNINLPDSSHHDMCNGMLMFSLNTKSNLPFGTNIDNKAGIFFDDNAVVVTNMVRNIIGFPEAVNNMVGSGKIQLYPNPVVNELIIKTDNDLYSSCSISNSMGQVVRQLELMSRETKVNVKGLSAGLYYVSLKGEKGSVVRKFVKM